MKVLARIQAHPSRSHLHATLAESLGLPVEISLHESIPPDPWGGYRQCLSNLPDCSHVLIVQDDAQPVPNFGLAVEKIAQRNPNTPVCLFIGAAPASTAGQVRRAMKKGNLYAPLLVSNFVPLVSVLWPAQKAQEFLYWAKANRVTRADDGNAARWMRRTKQQFLVSVPSLVEHNDHIPSVKGGRMHKFGAESWRRSIFLAENALDYDW